MIAPVLRPLPRGVRPLRSLGWVWFAVLSAAPAAAQPAAGAGPDLAEASIEELHRAMEAGQLTARGLVEHALARIEAYDDQGPTLNAISLVNRRALARADSLDAAFRKHGITGPLHGIPVVVKDNIDVAGMRTTAGSSALASLLPEGDAEVVARLRAAGAVILAKSNMAEFALSSTETVSTSMPGQTFNPYALNRSPGGSSGGSAVAVAAGYVPVGLGTDTGSSIRGPAAWTSTVGLRPTFGLVSRSGVFPLYRDRDIVGPLTRTVRDAALVLEALAGPDPDDPTTEAAEGHSMQTAVEELDGNSLHGVRIGVLRQLALPRETHPDVLVMFELALIDLQRAGAILVDPLPLPEMDEGGLGCERFQHDLDVYLRGLGEGAPFTSFEDLLARGRLDEEVRERLEGLRRGVAPEEDPVCRASAARAERLRGAFAAAVREHDLDVLVHPTWRFPPPLIADEDAHTGNTSHRLAVPLGLPAVTVPMGFIRGGLPTGLQFVGPWWSDAVLLDYAFAYEQHTRNRRAPASTPPLRAAGRPLRTPGWGQGG